MKKIPLFINPNARSAKLARIKNWVQLHDDAFRVIETESPAHMHDLARECADAGESVVAVAGGDGTLSMAAKALLGTETALGVVPSGTVNVFARELGLYNKSFSKAWDAIRGGYCREIDIFTVNGQPFLQMGGVGLDARAVELTSLELKRQWGPLAYLICGFKALREQQPKLTLTTNEGERYEGIAAIFGNGSQYGGPMRVFADAAYNDGLIDVILFNKTTGSIIKDCLFAGVRGGFSREMQGDFSYIRTMGCLIESDIRTPYELDGDLGGEAPLSIAKVPHALKVMTLPPR